LTSKLLSGVKVIDLTNILSGPLCSHQMVMLGAEVIKIERPGTGDLSRKFGADSALNAKLMGVSFCAVNAGKKSITLNLKDAEGKAILKQLVKDADVVMENFLPGTMKSPGLNYDVLKEVNPGLIYCALSGFGQTGPLSHRPVYDQIIQGFCGIMALTGDAETAPRALRIYGVRHHGIHDGGVRNLRGTVQQAEDAQRGNDRCVHAECIAVHHGDLDHIQFHECRPGAGSAGQ